MVVWGEGRGGHIWGCFLLLFFLEKSQSSRNQSTQKIKQFNKANVKNDNRLKNSDTYGNLGEIVLSSQQKRKGRKKQRKKKLEPPNWTPWPQGLATWFHNAQSADLSSLHTVFTVPFFCFSFNAKLPLFVKWWQKYFLGLVSSLTEVIYTKKLTQSSVHRRHPTQVNFPFTGSILPRGSPLSDFAILPQSGPTTFPHFSLHCFPLWNLHRSQAVLPIISQTSLPHARLCLGSCWPFLDSLNNLVA